MNKGPASLIDHYRILDLTDEKGYLCGKILADLGADVIKVEKPGGDPGRKIGPFYKDIPDPEKSLFWFAYNSNKRSITLNIETTRKQNRLNHRILHSGLFGLIGFRIRQLEPDPSSNYHDLYYSFWSKWTI